MTPSVHLVRHGRTAWSDDGRLQGWNDVPLSPNGRAEAASVAADLADRDVSTVVTSPIQRAADTAARIATATGAPVVRNPDWRERSFGTAEGDFSDNVFDADPAIHPRRDAFDPSAAPPRGESVEDVSQRVQAAWNAVVQEVHDTGTSTVVVSHVTPIRLVLGILRSLTLAEAVRTPSPATGSVTTIDVTGSATALERVDVDPGSVP